MSLTATQFAERAARQARAEKPEATSGLYLASAARLIPRACHTYTDVVAMVREKRMLQMKTFTQLALTSGVGDISSASYSGLYRGALMYGVVFDLGEDPNREHPLVFKANYFELYGQLDNNFGFFALKDGNTIITRHVGDSGSGALASTPGPLEITTVYIPDLSSDFPIPAELEDEYITQLAQLMLAEMMPSV